MDFHSIEPTYFTFCILNELFGRRDFLFMIEMVFSFFDIDCQKNTTTLYNILCNNMYD